MNIYFLGLETLEFDYNLSLTTLNKMQPQLIDPPSEKLRDSELGLRIPFFSII